MIIVISSDDDLIMRSQKEGFGATKLLDEWMTPYPTNILYRERSDSLPGELRHSTFPSDANNTPRAPIEESAR